MAVLEGVLTTSILLIQHQSISLPLPVNQTIRASFLSQSGIQLVGWFSIMLADLARQILLPVSDAGIPAAKACYVPQVIPKQRKEIRSHDR